MRDPTSGEPDLLPRALRHQNSSDSADSSYTFSHPASALLSVRGGIPWQSNRIEWS
jgi:hypothetical protein